MNRKASTRTIRLQLRDDALVLNDNGGRSIHFEPLLPGEAVYSRSESMWLVRGGKAAQPDGHTLARLWGALPPDIRLSPHLYLATNSAQGPWWILGWSVRVPGAEDVLPAPLPPYRVLTGMADRFGRTLTYRREAAGDLAGEITGVTDGAGREFRLVLTTQAQRAEEARTSSLSSSDSSRPLSASAFPDTLPGTEYGPDTGACRWRSSAKTAIRRGAGSMMNGATSLMRRTRIMCISRTVCQGSSMMRNQGCTITVTGTTIRCRGGILLRTRWG